MQISEIKVKSVLNRSKLNGDGYTINPYVGCQHACVYCYAFFMKRLADHPEPWGEYRFGDNMMNLHFVLDNMQASGYPVPDYVNYRRKAASGSDERLDGREELWLEAIKLACTPMRLLEKQIRFRKIADVADRYGIREDIDRATVYVSQLEQRREGIRTTTDFRKAADWLERHPIHLPRT